MPVRIMPLLAHRDFGGAGRPPLIVLHGLLGAARNWQSAGRDLAADFHVCALDLRNHGESFHARESGYGDMAADVLAWLDAHGRERVHLLGHSMGGKIAMRLACRHPKRVQRGVRRPACEPAKARAARRFPQPVAARFPPQFARWRR